jgi:Flp pilus assembly protein TadD
VDGSLAAATEAQRILSSSAPILVAMGDVWLRKGEFSKAAGLYQRALQIDPTNGRAFMEKKDKLPCGFCLAQQEPSHRVLISGDM